MQYNEFENNFENIEKLLNPQPNQNEFGGYVHNPYSIANSNNESDHQQTKNNNNENKNAEYSTHLTKVYSFWRILLPKIYRNSNELQSTELGNETNRIENRSIVVAATPQYKHAFYSMLTLVCLLLAILCICLYLLKNNKNINVNFL